MKFIGNFEKLNLIDEKKFLEVNYFFDFENPQIKQIVERIKNGFSEKETAKKLFYFVRDKIPYTMITGFSEKKDYKASEILKRGRGFCIQKAVLLVAMLRCAGIPSAIAFADIVNYKIPEEVKDFLGTNYFPFHGFVVLKIENKWLKATPTFDRETCLRTGYPVVEFDGENDCTLPLYTESGEKFVEYKKFYGVSLDMPLKKILSQWEKVYGKDKIKLWVKKLK